MKNFKTKTLAICCALSVTGCANIDTNALIDIGTQIALQSTELGQQSQNILAIKQILNLSGDRASSILSDSNVWNLVLPEDAQKVAQVMRIAGLGNYVNNVESSMKQAAALAAKESAPIFKQAVADMSIVNAIEIIQGGPTAATSYFQGKTETALRGKFQPIISNSLQKTGYYKEYQEMLNIYDSLPLTNKPNLNLEGYLLDKTINSMFEGIAQQESLIRQDPVGRGNQLIDRVLKTTSK